MRLFIQAMYFLDLIKLSLKSLSLHNYFLLQLIALVAIPITSPSLLDCIDYKNLHQ